MISIITPTYNCNKFIHTCIDNVVQQNCSISEVEHIIIDGGSRDGTVDTIKMYADQYAHIRWISEKDQGQSDAMNKGIRMAKGDIISFLNVDDSYELNTLKRILEIFKTLPEPSFLVGNCKVWNDKGELIAYNKTEKMTFGSVYIGMVSGKFKKSSTVFPVNPSCYFYHRIIHNKIGYYDIGDHFTMDFDFILRVLNYSGIHVVYKDEDWGNYLQLLGTKTSDQNLLGNTEKNLIRTLEKNCANLTLSSKINIAFLLYDLHAKSKRKFFSKLRKLMSY